MLSRRSIVLIVLLAGAWRLPGEDTWKGVARIVAVGDVHGDYGAFTGILRAAGVLDSRARWAGGRTHLVQAGDMIDRGGDSRRLLDLLMSLEKQARSAGGAVHALIGNHEAMNLYGDLRYVSSREFAAFRDENSERVRDLYYRQHVQQLRDAGQPEPAGDYQRKWMAAHPLGFFELLTAFAPNGTYGRWIASHNTIIRINDVVFAHGGIGPKYAASGIGEINNRVREELRDPAKLPGGVVMDPEGPLWFRGLAQGDEDDLRAHLASVLGRLEARYLVIAHTPTRGYVDARFNGQVFLIDVGLSQYYGAHPACLVIESGKFYALHRGTKLELTVTTPADLMRYRGQVEQLDRAAR